MGNKNKYIKIINFENTFKHLKKKEKKLLNV